MTNRRLAELLAELSAQKKPPLSKALSRASRLAFRWPIEAARLYSAGEPLQSLPGIGPSLALIVRDWIENPPPEDETPELRRHFLTMAEALTILEPLPEWRGRGDLQMHTKWSDGSGEIEDMAEAARERGYDYIAITDHTNTLKIANGMSEERLAEQGAEIDALNARGPGVEILKSAEVNLDPRGELDMSPECLRKLDLVLACFHSKLRLKEDQTERYLAALRNPSVHILGHPRGRVYNFRLGLQADWERVLDEAARLDKAVEVDCFPDRQDLDFATLEIARRAGVRISLGTDAHAPHQFGFLELGLAAVWRAGIPRDRVLNFLGADELKGWAQGLNEKAGLNP